jgi:hypothetical protein
VTADPLARPIFVVAPPRAGSRLVAGALATPGCWTIGLAAGSLIAAVPELDPPDGSRGGRLSTSDCTPDVRQALRAHLQIQFARLDRAASDQTAARGTAAPRLLHAPPRSALSVPFLHAAFPDATFVYVHREPADALAEALLLWRAGMAITFPELPGWTGPAWSFLLVPGWQELIGRPLAEVVTEQWVRTMQALTGDLERLAPERWCVIAHDALQRDPQAEAARLDRYLGLEPAGARPELSTPARFAAADLAAARTELEPYLDRTTRLADHSGDWLAEQQPLLGSA